MAALLPVQEKMPAIWETEAGLDQGGVGSGGYRIGGYHGTPDGVFNPGSLKPMNTGSALLLGP